MAEAAPDEFGIGYGHCSRQGVRPSMEDAVVTIEHMSVNNPRCTSGTLALFAVFDGHGGSQCAEYCAKHLQRILARYIRVRSEMDDAITDAIAELDSEAMDNAADASGSTGTIVLIDKQTNDLWVANVGDSRAILSTKSQQFTQLSIEHKPSDPKEKQRIEAAEGWVAFNRVMGILAVSRSFGDKDFKLHMQNLIISTPDITHHVLTEDDEYIVLACDGLWDVFPNKDAVTFVAECVSAQPNITLDTLSRQIVQDAIVNRKSKDNVSTILIKVKALRRPKRFFVHLDTPSPQISSTADPPLLPESKEDISVNESISQSQSQPHATVELNDAIITSPDDSTPTSSDPLQQYNNPVVEPPPTDVADANKPNPNS